MKTVLKISTEEKITMIGDSKIQIQFETYMELASIDLTKNQAINFALAILKHCSEND